MRRRQTQAQKISTGTDRQVQAQIDKFRHRQTTGAKRQAHTYTARQVQAQKTHRYRQTNTVTKRTARQELVFYAKAQTERALSACLDCTFCDTLPGTKKGKEEHPHSSIV
jgi:hypothetical protein